MTDYLNIVLTCAADILGTDPSSLDPDIPGYELGLDDDDYYDLLERCADLAEVDIHAIYSSAPVYHTKRGEYTLVALQNIAAFHPKAAQLLEKYSFRMEADTLRSISKSLEAGKYVKSGLKGPLVHAPHRKSVVFLKYGLIFLVGALWPFRELTSCNYAQIAAANSWETYIGTARWSIPIASVIMSGLLLPGCIELFHAYRKERRRTK